MDYGVDVSNHNSTRGPMDWSAAHGNGITFASAKATEGTAYQDPYLAQNVDGAAGADMAVGAYHFARPGDGAEQARYFADYAAPTGVFTAGHLAPMLDVEDVGVDDAFIGAWIPAVRQAAGVRKVIVYANLDFFQHRLNPDLWVDGDVYLWCADYTGEPGDTGGWTHPRLALHQHTDAGVVPGLPGLTDRDETINGYSLADLIIGGSTMSTFDDVWRSYLHNLYDKDVTAETVITHIDKATNDANDKLDLALAQLAALAGTVDKDQAAVLAAIQGVATGNVNVSVLAASLTAALTPALATELGNRLLGQPTPNPTNPQEGA